MPLEHMASSPDGDLLFVLNVTLHTVQLLSEQPTRSEVEHALVSSSAGRQTASVQGTQSREGGDGESKHADPGPHTRGPSQGDGHMPTLPRAEHRAVQ